MEKIGKEATRLAAAACMTSSAFRREVLARARDVHHAATMFQQVLLGFGAATASTAPQAVGSAS